MDKFKKLLKQEDNSYKRSICRTNSNLYYTMRFYPAYFKSRHNGRLWLICYCKGEKCKAKETRSHSAFRLYEVYKSFYEEGDVINPELIKAIYDGVYYEPEYFYFDGDNYNYEITIEVRNEQTFMIKRTIKTRH